MKEIDDFTFCNFVANKLSTEEMKAVERELIQAGEAESSLIASMAYYKSNLDLAEELIGLGEEYDEKNNVNDARNEVVPDSELMKPKNKNVMNTMKFNPAELAAVTNRYNEIHGAANATVSLKENLVAYYLAANELYSREQIEETVTKLMKGVDDLTSKFKEALENGWNPTEDIKGMTTDMTTQERYNFLVNAIAMVNTINTNALGGVADLKSDVASMIEQLKSEKAEVSDGVCEELQTMLAEQLSSSSLMLAGEEQIKEMMNAARGTETQVVDFAATQYDDYRYKCEMALAAWIEYEKGNLPSISENTTPETLGVSIAAGVEEAHIIEQVASGNKTVEWAVKCLKILGGIALVCLLGYVVLLGGAFLMGLVLETGLLLLGTSGIAIFISMALAFLATWGYADVAVKAVTKVMEWSGEAYDFVVQKMKDNVFPAIKKWTLQFVSWVRSLFQGSTGGSAQQEQVSIC